MSDLGSFTIGRATSNTNHPTSGAVVIAEGEARSRPRRMQHVPVGRWRRDELDDIDEVAVRRAVDGDESVNLNRGERFLAVVELRRRGRSYLQIAAHLQLDPHQVYRYLHRAGVVVTSVKVAS